MKVFFMPQFSGNPYQSELADALRRRGDTVVYSAPGVGFALTLPRYGVPDVVHLHWITPLIIGDTRFGTSRLLTAVKGGWLVVQLVLLKLLGVTIVFTVHNLLDHERRAPRVERNVNRLVARLADSVIYHCPGAIEAAIEAFELPESHRQKATVVPHGHYVDSYPNDVSRREARAALSLDDDEFVFLYLGQLRKYKNIPELIEAFEHLPNERARLLVVGKPADESLVRQVEAASAADDRIRVTAQFIPEEDLQQYLNAADAMVLPFRHILMSGSVILGMSFGKPVVTPDLGCLDYYLGPVTRELMYDPDDPDGLYEAMNRALSADTERIGRANFERVRELDWDDVAGQTREAYDC